MTSALPPLLVAPARALEFADRHAHAMDRVGMAVVVACIMAYCTWAATGVNGVVAAGVTCAGIAAVIVGARRAPQLTGTLASTVGFTAAVLIVATCVDPLSMFVGVDEYALIYPVVFVCVAAVAWLMPSVGVHRGWTTVVGHTVVAVTIPVAVVVGDSQWRDLVIVGGTVAGIMCVAVRIRHVPRGRRGGRKATVARAAGLAAVALLLGLVGVVGNASTARAFDFESPTEMIDNSICDLTRPDMSPEPVGTGPESLIPNFNFAQAKRLTPSNTDPNGYPQYADVAAVFEPGTDNSLSPRYTLYEVAGLRGIKWINWQWTYDWDEECSVPAWLSVTLGNLMLKTASYYLQGTIAFKEYSQVSNPLDVLYSKANPIVDSLFVSFFTPAAGVMFLVVGISMAVKSIKSGGFREAVSDLGGALLVCFIAGFAYTGISAASFANPNANGFYTLGSTLDELGGSLNAAVAELFFSALDSTHSSMCVRPEGGDNTLSPNAPGQRITSCLLAETLAYKPWAVGQFGAAGMNEIPADGVTPATDPRPEAAGEIQAEEGKLPCYNNYDGCKDMRSYLIAQIGGPDISIRYQQCRNSHNAVDDPAGAARVCEPYNAVAKQLYSRMEAGPGDPRAQEAAAMMSAYRGSGFMPHLSQSVAAMAGVVTVGIGLCVLALITLGWHAWLFVLFLMGMVRLLWAVYPGKAHLATSWAKEVVGTFTQRILYGMAMSAMIWIIATVFQLSLNSGLKILWSIVVLIGTFMAIRKIQTVAAADSPNIARVGMGTVGMPASAAGYAGLKTAKHAGKEAVHAGSRATGTVIKQTAGTIGRAGKTVSIEGGRVAGKAVTRRAAAAYTSLGQKALDGNRAADAIVTNIDGARVTAGTVRDRGRVALAKAQQVGGTVKDLWSMSASEQMHGPTRQAAVDKRRQAYEATRDSATASSEQRMRAYRDQQSLYSSTRADVAARAGASPSGARQPVRDTDAQREARKKVQHDQSMRAAERSRKPRSGPPSGGDGM